MGHREAPTVTNQPYLPHFEWFMTKIDERDTPTEFDWIGLDGPIGIGRIRKELNGPLKGKWQWSGWFPSTHSGQPPSPNTGHCETARNATEMVERYYAKCLRDMQTRQCPLRPEVDYRRFAHIQEK
jgi:hypothetical protein